MTRTPTVGAAARRSSGPRSAATCRTSRPGGRSRRATHRADFIFEDDFDAGPDLAEVLRLLSDDGGRDWDMVKLFSFDADPARPSPTARSGTAHRIVIPDRVPTCLIGYGVTRAAAAHLAARAIPFFRPVDEDQKFFWETGMRNALVLPPPVRVGDQQTVTGTIGVARRTAAKAIPRRPFHTLRYQIGYRMALARANRNRRRGS